MLTNFSFGWIKWRKIAVNVAAVVPYEYSVNDATVGDVDGKYEIILKWDPSNSKDNSQDDYTGNVYINAYKLNGKRLWRIDLGKNISAGVVQIGMGF